jgi:DNA-binding NtrC family response regulator
MKKILIVDDERSLASTMSGFFELKGLDSKVAFSGEEALDILEKETFFLMITDIVMPGISGLELLKIVKRKYPQMEVIVMTGMLSIENTVSSLQNGACDYFIKPFSSLEYVWNVVKEHI